MRASALLFMVGAWVFVLGLTIWSFKKLLSKGPEHEKLPPPGSIP